MSESVLLRWDLDIPDAVAGEQQSDLDIPDAVAGERQSDMCFSDEGPSDIYIAVTKMGPKFEMSSFFFWSPGTHRCLVFGSGILGLVFLPFGSQSTKVFGPV